jgi:hypothetical protein
MKAQNIAQKRENQVSKNKNGRLNLVKELIMNELGG